MNANRRVVSVPWLSPAGRGWTLNDHYVIAIHVARVVRDPGAEESTRIALSEILVELRYGL